MLFRSNVCAAPLKTTMDIRADLRAQLTSRVRWTESMQTMISSGITTFVELGTGDVLSGLIKRIDRSVRVISVGDPEGMQAVEALAI